MKTLIFLITIIAATATLLHSNEEDYIIWKYINNSAIENAYFGGEEDELIIIVGNNSIFKISTQDNKLLDSINLPRGTESSAITNDGKKLFVSIQEKILKFNVYDLNEVDSLTTIPLSGRLDSDYLVHAYRMLKLSEDNKFLTCIYIEANGTERLTQILVYDLELNTVIKRFDKNNTNLIDYTIEYENPTFIKQDQKIIFSSKTNSKDSLLSQVFILDYKSDELEEVIEARNKLQTFSDYYLLNESLINISKSSLPYSQSFNVLDLRTNEISIFHDFGTYPGNFRPLNPYVINPNLVLITINDSFQDIPCLTFLDLDSKLISKFYFEVPLRGFNIDINKPKDRFISYSRSEIYLHDLTKYLAETSIEHEYGEEILISPNPTADFLNIDTELIIDEIEILNIEGKLMFTTDEKLIDISQLSSGIYYLVIKSGKQTVTKQFNVVR